MNILYPVMLWFLALIPALLLLHLLKPKPKQMDVANLFLWQELLKERGGNITFKRLTNNLSLWLQILMILLLALALTQPVWTRLAQQRGDVIVIMDVSASMNVRTPNGTRFELAQKEADDLIDQLDRNQQVMLITAGYDAAVAAAWTDDHAVAKQTLRDLKATDAPARLEQSLFLAASFLRPNQEDAMYLLTDGADRNLREFVSAYPQLTPLLVSGGEKNIGITKFEFRQSFAAADEYEIMVIVKNFSPVPMASPLRLFIDRRQIFETQVALEPGEDDVVIAPYSRMMSGIAKIELDVEDDFDADNRAYLALNATKDLWVLLASKGNFFIERLLEAYPNILITRLDAIEPETWQEQARRHDIAIVDRMDIPATNSGNLLLLDAYSPSIPIRKTGEVAFPAVTNWDRRSPLLANADPRNTRIEQAARVESDPVVQTVIESPETPLMMSYNEHGLRAVFLGFDVARSDLPIKVAFPVIMSNLLNWLNPQKLTASTLYATAGTPFPIYVSPDTTEFATRVPGGKSVKHQVTSSPFLFTDTNQVGIYDIVEGGKTRYFTVNLVNEEESNIIPPQQDFSNQPRAAASAETVPTQQPLWMWLVMAALLTLMGEWFSWLKVG